jgi:sulfite exporter TauE/SafE
LFEGFGTGLTLGLATGTACLASCGPIYATYLLSERRTGLQSLWVILKLNAGRFLAYALFGAIVGYLGGAVPVSIRVPLALSGYILFSLYLLLSVIRVRKTCSGCNTGRFLKITRSSFLLGVLTGFSICPAFLIALTRAFDSNGAVHGMMMFIGFYVGTTVYMLPFAIFGLLTMKDWITKAARIIAVVVAIYFMALGIRGIVGWYSRPQSSEVSQHGAVESSGSPQAADDSIFDIENADIVYILTFPDDPDDFGARLSSDLNADFMPLMQVVETDSVNWRSAMAEIPDLSAVILPAWVDDRFGARLSPWQDSLATMVKEMRLRAFAVEYQPYCSDRAQGIQSFLQRYSFRTNPDSGFVFLMLNPLNCSPSECSTCDIPH